MTEEVENFRTVSAYVLNVEIIGQVVRFDQRLEPGHVQATVTGELRQIYHTGTTTTINIAAVNAEESTGDLWEATLEHDCLLEVLG